MKSFDTRAYSINDFLEWDKNNQIELNPRFQRRSVWSDNARSYLMDTIIRGKPIPKVFIRQRLNPTTKQSIREVVDGQQRLRTILLYLKDGFQINKKHNADYGGLYFSQLNQVDDKIQENILTYEIAVDLLINVSDSEVLDIFSRLNSYAVILNEQERINADHFGPFKKLTEQLGHKFYDFWVTNKILSDPDILRMGDVTLVADLLIAMVEGIKSKKQIKNYFDLYEKEFEHDPAVLENEFNQILALISTVFDGSLRSSEFRRISLFYSLFTSVYHLQYGLKELDLPRRPFDQMVPSRVRTTLESIENLFAIEDKAALTREQAQFIEDSRRATTDAATRIRRTRFLTTHLLSAN